MSPERNGYGYKVADKSERKSPATQKVENYQNTRSWGTTVNKRISQTGVWRK